MLALGLGLGINKLASTALAIPVNVTPPVIAQDGDQIILVSAGVWTGGAVVLTYDVVLPHTLVEGEYLADFVVTETGTNALGSDTADSNTVVPFYDLVAAATTETLPDGYTVTRPTMNGASRFDDTGTMAFEDADVARFDYDPSTLDFSGLYLEPESTNLLKESKSFSSWAPENMALGVAVSSSPDGETNASSFSSNASNAKHDVYYSFTTVDIGGSLSTTLFLKRGTGTNNRYVEVATQSIGNYFYSIFDLLNVNVSDSGVGGGGTLTNTSIVSSSDGFYKVKITGTLPTDYSYTQVYSNSTGSGHAQSFVGDNTVNFYGFGVQQEKLSVSTSYIPTTSAAVTRPAEAHHINIPATVSSIRVSTDELADQDVLVSALTSEGSNIYTLVSANVTGTHVRTVGVTP